MDFAGNIVGAPPERIELRAQRLRRNGHRQLVEIDRQQRQLLMEIIVQLARDPSTFLLLRNNEAAAQLGRFLLHAPGDPEDGEPNSRQPLPLNSLPDHSHRDAGRSMARTIPATLVTRDAAGWRTGLVPRWS